MKGICRMGIGDGIKRRRNVSTNLKSQGSIITKVNEDVGIGVDHHHTHQIIHRLHRYHRGVEGIMIEIIIGAEMDMNQGTAAGVEVEVPIGITAEEMIEEGITAGVAGVEVIVQGIDAVVTLLDRTVGVEVETQGIGGNMTVTGGRGYVTNTKIEGTIPTTTTTTLRITMP